MKEHSITGLHHVTCIASDPQANLDFYTRVLGQRMVKLTVNFDDPGTYHFYFGDEAGSPGTLMTFFPWPGAARGRVGNGQASATAFSIPVGAGDFWLNRLRDLGVDSVEEGAARFGERVIRFADPDGLPLELIESFNDPRAGRGDHGVPGERSIRGFHSVTLAESEPGATVGLLTETMGLRLIGEEEAGRRLRYAAGEAHAGMVVDIVVDPSAGRGLQGAGTVHHIAWRTPDDAQQAAWLAELGALGLPVSPVMDRFYFHSIYFREPGGVLFEIATDPPGMAIDEPIEHLGESLVLPQQYEPFRGRLEKALPRLVRSDFIGIGGRER